jgi:small subunit ribosomal protein S1
MSETFKELLESSYGLSAPIEGTVVKGTVVSKSDDFITIDVGLKSEGRVPLKEFGLVSENHPIVGDVVEVYLERMENRHGEAALSREKACREASWAKLATSHENEERVTGVIFGRVKGGFTVDLDGTVAFLPMSQIDIRPIKDPTPLMNTPQPFQILKMDRKRGNIVVSRRAILEESQAEERNAIIKNLSEGQKIEGVVKNITDYGAFVDLGGVDGLLHVTDIAWKRINHPSEALQVGQTLDVKIIKFSEKSGRISLGVKQLTPDPWTTITERFAIGSEIEGTVTNITDYGAFIDIGDGIEGLAHVSEMSWTKKNVHPGKILSTSEKVKTKILDIDANKRRISLGIKQCEVNPWVAFAENYPADSVLEGDVKNTTEFGLFVGLPGDIDGMVHLSDLDWKRPGEEALADYKKSQTVKVKVLEVDVEKERISLGIKQLADDPLSETLSKVKRGSVVTCTISNVTDNGLEVTVGGGLPGFIKRADLSRDRASQRVENFATGEKVDAKVLSVDSQTRVCSLSIKAYEVEEEEKAMREYGSSDSGASLGDILGAALEKKAAETGDTPEASDAAKAKKPAAKKAAAKKTETKTAKTKVATEEAAETKTSDTEVDAKAEDA